MAILIKISLNKIEMAPNQQRIADFILTYPEKALSASSQQLAQSVGVSQSAVVKFSQKMGFKGFPALKLAISEELGRNHIQAFESHDVLHNKIEKQDGLSLVAQKLAQEKHYSIIETTKRINFVMMKKVIDILDCADRIQIVGIGGSGLTAKDLSYKLQKIGMTSLVESDSHVQIAFAQTLKPTDCQIVISFSGKRKDSVAAASIAKKQGANIIVITGNCSSPLARMADFVFESVAQENEWRSSSISSRTAQNTITDLLFMALLQKREDTARQLVINARKMINSLDE